MRAHHNSKKGIVIPPRSDAADVLLRGPTIIAHYMVKYGRNLWPSVRMIPPNVRASVLARDPKCELSQAILSIA